ncbi:transposase [Natrinema gelatinilyticum]|uniref:transposase n=1 Tax=Natrinema gelatinilyticum TaxID=2961571 RepID=UPI003CE557D2
MFDGGLYFQASGITDLASRDGLELVALPSSAPELNLVETSWKQRHAPLSNRFVASLEELTPPIDDEINCPRQTWEITYGCFPTSGFRKRHTSLPILGTRRRRSIERAGRVPRGLTPRRFTVGAMGRLRLP